MIRSDIITEAAALLGTLVLAEELGVDRRTIAYWQDPHSGRSPSDDVMRRLLPLLDAHVARAAALRRQVTAEIFAAHDARPTRADRSRAAASLLKEAGNG